MHSGIDPPGHGACPGQQSGDDCGGRDGRYYIILERGILAEENGSGENWEGILTISREGRLESGEKVPVKIYYGTKQGMSPICFHADFEMFLSKIIVLPYNGIVPKNGLI